jgi:hypothetical protein
VHPRIQGSFRVFLLALIGFRKEEAYQLQEEISAPSATEIQLLTKM